MYKHLNPNIYPHIDPNVSNHSSTIQHMGSLKANMKLLVVARRSTKCTDDDRNVQHSQNCLKGQFGEHKMIPDWKKLRILLKQISIETWLNWWSDDLYRPVLKQRLLDISSRSSLAPGFAAANYGLIGSETYTTDGSKMLQKESRPMEIASRW